jgi:hypothetical protein
MCLETWKHLQSNLFNTSSINFDSSLCIHKSKSSIWTCSNKIFSIKNIIQHQLFTVKWDCIMLGSKRKIIPYWCIRADLINHLRTKKKLYPFAISARSHFHPERHTPFMIRAFLHWLNLSTSCLKHSSCSSKANKDLQVPAIQKIARHCEDYKDEKSVNKI